MTNHFSFVSRGEEKVTAEEKKKIEGSRKNKERKRTADTEQERTNNQRANLNKEV